MLIYTSLPELRGATVYRDYFYKNPIHIHYNLELIYGLNGIRTAIVSGKKYIVEPRGLLILFPYQLHEYPASGEGDGYGFVVNPQKLPECADTLLEYLPESPYIPPDQLSERMKSIIELITTTPEQEDQYRRRGPISNALCCALTLELLATVPLVPNPRVCGSDTERMLSICMEHCADPEFSLDTLANTVGMSRRTVSRFFNDRMGISFPKFMSMLRMHRSVELIREGHSVLETAMICGLGSVRSFNRVFSDEYGMPPREYVRQMTDNSRK